VVDAGSLSAGARALRAPLPSVSRKMADLERHLGTKLLIRTSRKLQLTDAGRDFVASARQVLAQLDEAERRASGEYLTPRGELTITMPVEFGRRYIMPIAMEFLEAHPDITLDVLSLDRPMQLLEEHVDVGVRLGALADSGLFAVKVGAFRMVTCASSDYLARHPAADPHQVVQFSALDNMWWQEADAPPRTKLRANTAGIAVQAAVRGLGVLKALDFLVADELRTGSLVRLEGACAAARPSRLSEPGPSAAQGPRLPRLDRSAAARVAAGAARPLA
jgi:DNA-binding transcriptional LysR family regulator